jgi:hypothetical protein
LRRGNLQLGDSFTHHPLKITNFGALSELLSEGQLESLTDSRYGVIAESPLFFGEGASDFLAPWQSSAGQ